MGVLDFLNSAANPLAAVGGIVSSVVGAINNASQRDFERQEAEKQREWSEGQSAIQRQWNEVQVEKQNAWNLDMWNKQNLYNTPTEQVRRLRDAGLNPLFYGLDGSSAGSLTSAQPLGYQQPSYERAKAQAVTNPVLEGIEGFSQIRSLQKDIELKNAQIDKLKEDTKGVNLDNQWKDRTMEARADSISLSNSLTHEDILKVRKEKEKIGEEIQKLIAETKTEEERKLYVMAQTAVSKANEKEIISLLPYKQLLYEAQTEAEKADAAMKWTEQAYRQGLIDNGYLDALAENMKHEAKISGINIDRAEADKALSEWKAAVRGGTVIGTEGKSIFGKGMSVFGNTFLRATSQLSEAMGGSLSGLVSAGIIGKGMSKAGNAPATSSNPASHGKSTVLYDSDGKPAVTSSW